MRLQAFLGLLQKALWSSYSVENLLGTASVKGTPQHTLSQEFSIISKTCKVRWRLLLDGLQFALKKLHNSFSWEFSKIFKTPSKSLQLWIKENFSEFFRRTAFWNNSLRDRFLDRVVGFRNFCLLKSDSTTGASQQFWKVSNFSQEAFAVDSVFSIVTDGTLNSWSC